MTIATRALDAEQAERLTSRIVLRLGVIADNYEAVMPMIREAIEGRADAALGFTSPGDYISARFGDSLSRLGVDMRQNVERELRDAGLSLRAIAPVVGVDVSTVSRDLRRPGVADTTPARVQGLDGKSYSAAPAGLVVDHETGEVVAVTSFPKERANSPRTDVVRVVNTALTRAADAAINADLIKAGHLKDRSEEAAIWSRSLSDSITSLQRLMDLLTEAQK